MMRVVFVRLRMMIPSKTQDSQQVKFLLPTIYSVFSPMMTSGIISKILQQGRHMFNLTCLYPTKRDLFLKYLILS